MNRELGIVMPAYNEEKNLKKTIGDLLLTADKLNVAMEIVVVNDGSTDDTRKIVSALAKTDPRVILVEHEGNRGFGKAVRTGIAHSKKDRLLLVPADGQFDPGETGMFLNALDEFDLIIGVRSKRSGYCLFRQFVSFVYISLVKLLFNDCYRDTNWVQAWKREIFEKVKPESEGVFILQETITRARRAGYKIGEVESNHLERTDGEAQGGRLRVILFTLYEMLKFRFKPGSTSR